MLQELQTIFKLCLTAYLFKNLGFIYGLISVLFIFNIYRIFMNQVFNLEMCSTIDKLFIGKDHRERMVLQIVMEFENFNSEKLKNFFIEKAIRKIPKLRKRVVYFFGNYYWKDASIDECESKVEILSNLKIKDSNEAIKLAEKENNIHIDTLKTIPYEIKIIPYVKEEGKGMIIWKFDHLLSDGLGMVSTVCSMADNYNINILPSIMRSYKYKWYLDVIDWLLFVFYGPIVILNIFKMSITRYKSPFRSKLVSSGYSKSKISKNFELEKFTGIRKTLKISFNDMIMSIISKAAKRYINESKDKDIYKNLTNLNTFIPVGRKEVPECIENVDISNKSYAIIIGIPLIDNLTVEYSKLTESIKKSLNNFAKVNAMSILTQILFEYLPDSMKSFLLNSLSVNIDIAVSNVPGPNCFLYFAGSKVTRIIPMASTQRIMAFLPVFSYNNKFMLLMSADVESGIDNEMFIGYIEQELEKIAM